MAPAVDAAGFAVSAVGLGAMSQEGGGYANKAAEVEVSFPLHSTLLDC